MRAGDGHVISTAMRPVAKVPYQTCGCAAFVAPASAPCLGCCAHGGRARARCPRYRTAAAPPFRGTPPATWHGDGTRPTAWILALLCVLVAAGCERSGSPQAVWLETGPARGQVVYPRAITYSRAAHCFFVVDRLARIQRVEADGSVSLDWRMPQWVNGKPVGLSVGPDGNLYVADTHYSRVVVYSPGGHYLREWGSYGTGEGQFIYPTDVAFDADGNIYVSEYGDNDRIQVFDPRTHRVLRTIGRFGHDDGEFSRPQSILIDSAGLLYVADSSNHRIAVFRIDGTFLRNMGRVGSGPGEFRFPYGLDQDADGNLVVAEFGNNRVQLIDKQSGAGLKTWGAAGRRAGQLACPWAVAVDDSGRVVVVDSGNNRLQVFAW
jgi:DNA-binding beta-propeller fold protein YncE